MISAALGIGSMFFATWLCGLANERWPNQEALFGVLLSIAIMLGLATFVVCMFWWRTRCPECRVGTAKFTYKNDDGEFLTCDSCDYSEKTGYNLE